MERGQFAGSDFLQLPFRYDGYDGFFTCFSLVVAAVVSDRSSQIFTALSVKNQELFTLTVCSEINIYIYNKKHVYVEEVVKSPVCFVNTCKPGSEAK